MSSVRSRSVRHVHTTGLATVLTAARAVNDGVRHDEALALLDSVVVDDDRDHLAQLLATAEVVTRWDGVRGTGCAGGVPEPTSLST